MRELLKIVITIFVSSAIIVNAEITEKTDEELLIRQDSLADRTEWNKILEDIVSEGEGFTVEGDGLKVLREYKINGTEYEIAYTDDDAIDNIIADLPPDTGLIPIVLKRKMKQTLVYLDSNFNIANTIWGTEREKLSYIGDNGFYVKSSNMPTREGRSAGSYYQKQY